MRDEFYQNTGENSIDGERKLYRFNTFGNDAASFILDTRSFRDQGLEPVTNPTEETINQFLSSSFNSERTLLGNSQLEDLKNDLLQAENNDITWKFVMVSEPIQNLGTALASDRFEGYAAERTELLKFIDNNNTDFVSGKDKIILAQSTFSAMNNIESEFTTVTSNNAAATSESVIIYNTNNGQLFYNTNGNENGFGTGGQFATLSNETSLEVTDFIIR